MNTKSATVFTRTVYTDFLRFMLASLATGMVAAMLLSSAVILLSVPKAISNDEVITGDGGKRVRTTWAGLPGAEVA
ncbi:MAG: hypothetical protein A2Z01_02395 [Betaproteobacteria bacterium RBG_16_58_11]|nr:MAG: hypothetical protein A2Z01_02395 [Betaproteobacteria bacterium RBG_16_58_11]